MRIVNVFVVSQATEFKFQASRTYVVVHGQSANTVVPLWLCFSVKYSQKGQFFESEERPFRGAAPDPKSLWCSTVLYVATKVFGYFSAGVGSCRPGTGS